MYRLFGLTFATVITLWGAHAFGRSMESVDASIARQAMPAVVNISAWQVHPSAKAGGPTRRVKVYGSGFIVDPTGIIITNKHVVDDATNLTAIFRDGDRAPARLIAAAAMLDLAVLKVDVGQTLPYLRWGNSDALEVADPVLAIGNPLAIGMSVSTGVVSALNRDLQDTPFDSYIQTDAAINHGNSGGPLINQAGEVVGIDTALYNPDQKGGFIGIGFAIPSSTAKFVVGRLLDPSHPKPAWLGVTLDDMTQELARALGLPQSTGAIISEVDPAGPGSASLRPGDVLEALNGVRLNDSRAFMRAIVTMAIGQAAHLTVWRDGKEQEITATATEWPHHTPSTETVSPKVAGAVVVNASDVGITVGPITAAARRRYGLDAKLTGALVSTVERDSEAQDLGIEPGDVVIAAQSSPVATPDDFRRMVSAAQAQQRPYLAALVWTKHGARWVSLSLDDAGS
ncbi:MAG TPA: trypsin-like peptidase domain-containing protein [Acetobacteraceae bacterium]|jgi:serine protease Do|nr:trypsin-like peptidase domain-containing protein [Acetobacteraceae bacterium]